MSQRPENMVRPGVTVHIGAAPSDATALIERVLVARGYALVTRASAAESEWKHGSAGTTFLADAMAQVLPVFLLPPVWKQRKVHTVWVKLLADAGSTCDIRLTMRPRELRLITVPYFLETVAAVCEECGAQAVAVTAEEPSDG